MFEKFLRGVVMAEAGADGAGAGGGAAGAAGAAGTADGGAAGAAAPWFSGFEPELKGYIETKGFPSDAKGLAALANSYRNLEKHFGVPAEQLLKLPKDDSDKAAWDKIHERLGRPAKPEEYELSVPAGDSGEYAKFIATAMHELGITKKQAQALAAKNNEYASQAEKREAEAYQNTIKEQDTALRTEWGQGYDKNIQVARGSFAELGISVDVVNALEKAMGFAGVMKFFHGIGSKIGEDKFIAGGDSQRFNGVMSPEAARVRIQAIKSDPALSAKYIQGDAALRAEMDNLHRMLAG